MTNPLLPDVDPINLELIVGSGGVPFVDRLTETLARCQSPACVGFDPLLDHLPVEILRKHGLPLTSTPSGPAAPDVAAAEAIIEFGQAIIELTASVVPVLKINIAFFERYHAPGYDAYLQLVEQAQEAGLIVIGDVKRSDIDHTARQYAEAHLGSHARWNRENHTGEHAPPGGLRPRALHPIRTGDSERPVSGPPQRPQDESIAHPTHDASPDAITVNPYFGTDGITPFLDVARRTGRGLFVLVQTSNASADEIQGLILRDGSTVRDAVARRVAAWAEDSALLGACGDSAIGAVVAPREPEGTARLRALMPHCVFLVPGFGAQGRTASEVAACFRRDGTGAVVNASRSVIYAFENTSGTGSRTDWKSAVQSAVRSFVTDLKVLRLSSTRGPTND